MQHRLTLELSAPVTLTPEFRDDESVGTEELIGEIEISNTDSDLTLVVGGAVSITLTPRESVLLTSIILERAYKQIQ